MTAIFDGHNDALLRLWRAGDDAGASFITGGATGGASGDSGGQIDLPRARAGGMVGGLFAMFTPPPALAGGSIFNTEPVGFDAAHGATEAMLAIAEAMAKNHPDAIRICHDTAAIRAAVDAGALAIMLHIEGAETIKADLRNFDEIYARGVRSLGPVWSRDNAFACGVPFRFPSSPDIGGGLTGAGRDLVRACNAKGVMIDLSHINEAGFWDIAKLTSAPLVATHSNVHALCASSRNLTDRQLDAIAESEGLVGVNFAVGFLREDGKRDANTPLEILVRHIDYLLARLGENGVALGSDFDGAEMAAGFDSAAHLPKLVTALRGHGYDDALIAKICADNWLGMLEKTLG